MVGSSFLRYASGAALLTICLSGCGSSDNSSDNCVEECQNGGSCVEEGDAFACECDPEFSGEFCELAPCADSPCLNGGVCSANGSDFVCACEDGFGGDTCNAVVGISERPDNTTCIAPELPPNTGPLSWEAASWTGLSDSNLMMIAQAPDGAWFEIYRNGQVHRVTSSGTRSSTALLDIDVATDGEMGLLGLAIHPNYPADPYIYVFYTTAVGNTTLHLDQYTVSPATGGPDEVAIAANSRVDMFTYDRATEIPFHVGGTIAFDPTAATPTLYLGTGDAEQQEQSQNVDSMLGKLLRFDVSDPAANSFPPEVVIQGLRNPFRWSFDRENGDLWIGDVGDSAFEEVDHIPATDIPGVGGEPLNLGWPIMEGFACVGGGDPINSCGNPEPLYLPANTYDQDTGVSVIGGYAYRGSAIGGIDGTYFFNDFFPQSGEGAWRLDANPDEDPGNLEDDYIRTVLSSGGSFVGYAEDMSGELYALQMGGGIFRLIAEQVGPVPEVLPENLSEVGCFESSGEPNESMVPFEVHAPLWSDGATKRRWLALPNETSMVLGSGGDVEFPAGSVLAKEFTVDGERVETRLLMRHPNGEWRGYTYAWLDESGEALADAQLLTDLSVVTRSVPGGDASWSYPTRSQCLQCHTPSAGFALGPEVGQLNYEFLYPSGTEANQLATLSAVGMLEGDVASFNDQVLPAYDDTSASVADRAWSYMHANCSGCHQPGASGFEGRSNMPDMRFDLTADTSSGVHPLAERLCDLEPGAGDLDLGGGAQLVAPGNPGDWGDLGAGGSILYLRMAARPALEGTDGAMPQIGSALLDEDVGMPLVHQWITELVCP